MGIDRAARLDPHRPDALWGEQSRSQKVLGKELTPEEEARLDELKKRGREVRAHEQAHRSVAGQYVTGGPNYRYVTGPDGQRYAVEGEAQLDTSEVRADPEATIRKMQIIRRAALAPRDSSPQDYRVAVEASRKEAEARRELMEAKREEQAQQSQGMGAGPFSLPQVDVVV